MKKFQYIFICILAFMLRIKIFFWHKYKMSRIIEYKGKFLIQYFLDLLFALITSKIRLGILSTSFWSLTEGIFPMRLRLRFWVQKLLNTVDLLHILFQPSIPTKVWWACRLVKKSFFQASTFLLLMHCWQQYYLAEKSILLHIDDALLVRALNHLASSYNLLLFVPQRQIVI